MLLQIERREQALVTAEYARPYRDFLVYGFNQGEPTLKKAFRGIFTYPQFVRLSKDLGFAPESGATDLGFQQWLGLFEFFLKEVNGERKELVIGAEKHLRWQQIYLRKFTDDVNGVSL